MQRCRRCYERDIGEAYSASTRAFLAEPQSLPVDVYQDESVGTSFASISYGFLFSMCKDRVIVTHQKHQYSEALSSSLFDIPDNRCIVDYILKSDEI